MNPQRTPVVYSFYYVYPTYMWPVQLLCDLYYINDIQIKSRRNLALAIGDLFTIISCLWCRHAFASFNHRAQTPAWPLKIGHNDDCTTSLRFRWEAADERYSLASIQRMWPAAFLPCLQSNLIQPDRALIVHLCVRVSARCTLHDVKLKIFL